MLFSIFSEFILQYRWNQDARWYVFVQNKLHACSIWKWTWGYTSVGERILEELKSFIQLSANLVFVCHINLYNTMYMYIFFQRNIMWRQNTFLIELHLYTSVQYSACTDGVKKCIKRIHLYRKIGLGQDSDNVFLKLFMKKKSVTRHMDSQTWSAIYYCWNWRNKFLCQNFMRYTRILYIDKYTHFDIQCVQPNVFMDGFVNVIHFS